MAEHLDSLTDEAFRARFRAWLEAVYPETWRATTERPFRRLRGEEVRAWIALLNKGGWRAPAWPRAYGGLGLSFAKQVIYHEELDRLGAARVIDLGEVQLGPTLIAHGSEEQKARYLPGILGGEHLWCQGYSEPGAGSDLAALSTTAVRRGDRLIVNGQKIWTTHANESTHVFALVRTSREERRQDGITFLLMEMDRPGIKVRPIKNLAGEDEFCEVFFDDVEASMDDVVGEVGRGWTVAKALLGHERIWIGSPGLAGRTLALSRRLIETLDAPPELKTRYADLAIDLHGLRALYARICSAVNEGRKPGTEVSMLKVMASELQQRASQLNLDLGGGLAAMASPVEINGLTLDLPWQFQMSRPQAIFAGANEVQRNVLAKAMLELPS